MFERVRAAALEELADVLSIPLGENFHFVAEAAVDDVLLWDRDDPYEPFFSALLIGHQRDFGGTDYVTTERAAELAEACVEALLRGMRRAREEARPKETGGANFQRGDTR